MKVSWAKRDDLSPPLGWLDDLSAAEKRRAEEFRAEGVQQWYLLRRWWVRQQLGRALDLDPKSLDWEVGSWGKPRVKGRRWWFNLSHTDQFCVLVQSAHGEVGVDLEALRPVPEREALAETALSRSERRRWGRIPPSHRDLAFLHLWTQKEAFAKALGLGLGLPFDALEVSMNPEAPPKLLRWEGGNPADWTFERMSAPDGHLAVLCSSSR